MDDEAQHDIKMVQVVNTRTGEVHEWDITTDEQMAMTYDELTGLEGAIKRAKDKIKAKVIDRMGMDDHLDVNYTYQFKVVPRSTYEYYLPELRKWFDEDTLDVILKADTKKTDQLIKDFVESGNLSHDEAKAIRECKQAVNTVNMFRLDVHR